MSTAAVKNAGDSERQVKREPEIEANEDEAEDPNLSWLDDLDDMDTGMCVDDADSDLKTHPNRIPVQSESDPQPPKDSDDAGAEAGTTKTSTRDAVPQPVPEAPKDSEGAGAEAGTTKTSTRDAVPQPGAEAPKDQKAQAQAQRQALRLQPGMKLSSKPRVQSMQMQMQKSRSQKLQQHLLFIWTGIQKFHQHNLTQKRCLKPRQQRQLQLPCPADPDLEQHLMVSSRHFQISQPRIPPRQSHLAQRRMTRRTQMKRIRNEKTRKTKPRSTKSTRTKKRRTKKKRSARRRSRRRMHSRMIKKPGQSMSIVTKRRNSSCLRLK